MFAKFVAKWNTLVQKKHMKKVGIIRRLSESMGSSHLGLVLTVT